MVPGHVRRWRGGTILDEVWFWARSPLCRDPLVPARVLDRVIGILSAAFAILATILAAVGLYGVLAYTVAQQVDPMRALRYE